jgi:hypothetical protein
MGQIQDSCLFNLHPGGLVAVQNSLIVQYIMIPAPPHVILGVSFGLAKRYTPVQKAER